MSDQSKSEASEVQKNTAPEEARQPDGVWVKHYGRGGESYSLHQCPDVANHPRGSGTSQGTAEQSALSGQAKEKCQLPDGIPYYHQPSHPRGRGDARGDHGLESEKPQKSPFSLNELGLGKDQLAIVEDRINEVMRNQLSVEI